MPYRNRQEVASVSQGQVREKGSGFGSTRPGDKTQESCDKICRSEEEGCGSHSGLPDLHSRSHEQGTEGARRASKDSKEICYP